MPALTCLIVDDEPSVRMLLRSVLEQHRFKCLEAANASEAMGVVLELVGRIDLMITDVKMPGDMDGIDLSIVIHKAYPNMPIIIISGYSEQNYSRMPHDPKIEFTRKPFTSETFLRVVKKLVDIQQRGT